MLISIVVGLRLPQPTTRIKSKMGSSHHMLGASLNPEKQMTSLVQIVAASSVALLLLSGAGCVSNGSATAQAHDDAWCSNHPKQCDNQDWCAKNTGKCSTGSSAN